MTPPRATSGRLLIASAAGGAAFVGGLMGALNLLDGRQSVASSYAVKSRAPNLEMAHRPAPQTIVGDEAFWLDRSRTDTAPVRTVSDSGAPLAERYALGDKITIGMGLRARTYAVTAVDIIDRSAVAPGIMGEQVVTLDATATATQPAHRLRLVTGTETLSKGAPDKAL